MIVDDIDERRMTPAKESLIRARNEVALLKGNTQTKTSPRTVKLLLNEIDALRRKVDELEEVRVHNVVVGW